ncbi:DMT family transporter [Nitriliruptor alkaliphilus]|uniref:DMT family transporter n=1 Tax=Nitriliruptor alkaliphilus TaxID=427918 RepID=UPI0006983A36|nr:multidrug efflux SMR transporter [Nitriliruptor alkaliphilus]
MTAWGVLFLAGLLEIVWSLALDRADGLTRPGWAAFGMVTATASLLLLSFSLREIPLGTAYAVWVAIGTVGVATVGMVALDEPATLARLAAISLIVVGVVGLHATET